MHQLDHLVGKVIDEDPGDVVKHSDGIPLAPVEAEGRQPRVASLGVPKLLNEMRNKKEALGNSGSEVADLGSVGRNALLTIQ
ncbi:hypothetical protein V6N11_019306 [Hibiscus sabdariffa]|uniref:Uncharacterized protein n=2 Tax=Hibiscus sabdariffa TaxID=183260 RepID=A0ABR2R212_9ROSI